MSKNNSKLPLEETINNQFKDNIKFADYVKAQKDNLVWDYDDNQIKKAEDNLYNDKLAGTNASLKNVIKKKLKTFDQLEKDYPDRIDYINSKKEDVLKALNDDFRELFPQYSKHQEIELKKSIHMEAYGTNEKSKDEIQIEEMNKHINRKLGENIINDYKNLNNKPNIDINEFKPKQPDDVTNAVPKQKSGLEQGGDVYMILMNEKYTNEQLARYMLQYQNKGRGKVDSDFDVDKFVKEAPDEIIKKISKIQKINDSKSNITKAVGNFFSAIENMLNMGVKDVDIMKIHQAMSIAGKPSENKDITSDKALNERIKHNFSFIKTEKITSVKISDDKRIKNIKNNISKYVSVNQQPEPRKLNEVFKNIPRPVPPPSKGGRER